MSITMVSEPRLDLILEAESSPDEDIRTQIRGLLGTLYPHNDLAERRSEGRYPFPYLVQLTPADEDDALSSGETVVVVGKHLSERGLGFYHPKPLAHRRMIASLDAGGGRWIRFLIDLSWCRFIKKGWYESGGRFLRSVECCE